MPDRQRLQKIFDLVMQDPASARGMDVSTTCRLLAEKAKAQVPISEYEQTITDLEGLYLDQFLHTCLADPSFAQRVRDSMRLYL